MAVVSNLNQVPAYTFNGVNYDYNPIFNCGNWTPAAGCSVSPTAPPSSAPYVPYLGTTQE